MKHATLLSALLTSTLILASCTVNKGDRVTTVGVPTGAVSVKDGRGDLSYQADKPGHVYVYDETDDRLVYERHIANGDRFTFLPNSNRIELNGARITDRKLFPDHKHRIYFKAD